VDPTYLELITVHAHKPGNLDLLTGATMVNQTTLLEGTLVNPHISQLAEASFLELECQGNKWGLCSRNEGNRWGIGRKPGVMGNHATLRGISQIRTDTIQEWLYSGILDGRTKEDRRELETDGGATNSICDLFRRRGFIVEENLSHFIVNLGKLLNQFATLSLGKLENRLGNLVGFVDFDTGRSCETNSQIYI
jgi:hypothetical protein